MKTNNAPVGTSMEGSPVGPPLKHLSSAINFLARFKCPSRYGPLFSRTSGMYSYLRRYWVADRGDSLEKERVAMVVLFGMDPWARNAISDDLASPNMV